MGIKITTNQRVKSLTSQLMLLSLLCLALISCSHFDVAVDPHNKVISPEEASFVNNPITLAQVTQDISYLASDALQGRGNLSPKINEASHYIAKRFNEVGLIPAPNAPNFKQKYTLQHITPGAINVEINGEKMLPENIAMVTAVTNFQWHSVATPPLLNNNLKPAINTVFIGKNKNMRKTLLKLNKTGGEYLVLLHPKHEKSFRRYQAHFAKGLTKLATNNEKNGDSAVQKTIKRNGGGTIVMALTSIDNVIQYNITGTASVTNTELTNIIGMLPGKTKANEVVLYSAHYDHLGIKSNNAEKPSQTDNIYNGADDDASGVTAIISLANYFAKKNVNERTLMFAAFSAEELGGFGSRYFSKQLNPQDIIAMINIEMIGKPAIFGEGSVWMTGMERSNLGEQLNKALATTDLKVYADPYPNQKLFYRSDNATLARLGVPAHSFSSTQLDKDKHYHQVTDDIDSLNIPSMLGVIKTLAKATIPLVNGTVTPSRINPSKIRKVNKIY